MLIIIVTVVTQGAAVDPDLRGALRGSLFVNDGFFQAVGVISFGMIVPFPCDSANLCSFRLPSQFLAHLRLTQNSNNRPVLDRDTLQHLHFASGLSRHGLSRVPDIWR